MAHIVVENGNRLLPETPLLHVLFNMTYDAHVGFVAFVFGFLTLGRRVDRAYRVILCDRLP